MSVFWGPAAAAQGKVTFCAGAVASALRLHRSRAPAHERPTARGHRAGNGPAAGVARPRSPLPPAPGARAFAAAQGRRRLQSPAGRHFRRRLLLARLSRAWPAPSRCQRLVLAGQDRPQPSPGRGHRPAAGVLGLVGPAVLGARVDCRRRVGRRSAGQRRCWRSAGCHQLAKTTRTKTARPAPAGAGLVVAG